MENYYSYTDFLKAVGQYPHEDKSEKLMNEIYLDLFLNRLQRIQRIEELRIFIDKALDERNEQAFYQFAQELCELQETLI